MSNTTMTREQIEEEIRNLDQLMRANDYIGTKIAMAELPRKSMLKKLQNLKSGPRERMSFRPCWMR